MNEQNIYPVRYLRQMARGKSRPQLILLSDGNEYVMKFNRGCRGLVNEYVAAKLGALLSLPVLPFQIVHVSKDFINQCPQLIQLGVKEGNQFASLFIPNCTGINHCSRRRLYNPEALAGLIVFDHWISSGDRSKNNILMKTMPSGKQFYMYLIDHEKSFPGGLRWSSQSLQSPPIKLMGKIVHKWCASHILDRKELDDYVQRVKNLPEEQIFSVIESIPEDWKVSQQERDALLKHLLLGKKALSPLIESFIVKVWLKRKKNR